MGGPLVTGVQVDPREVAELGATDDELFCRFFFPKTFRQGFPSFHQDVDDALSNPLFRYVALKMFRGSAKTTKLRAFVSKRISYGISRTVFFVSNSQKHSIYSLKWIRRQVEYNPLWTNTFGLRKGGTWTDEWIQILHGVDEVVINILALGITGQIRGINIDDFRPDLIVLDDPDNHETTNTHEQREKTSDLIFGDLQKSLVPPTENPLAKMVALQTPLNLFDFISTVSGTNPETEKPRDWHVVEVSCFDKDNESTWPARYPTEFLRREKEEHIRLRKLSLWMREMEVKIIAKEESAFDVTWLKYWDDKGLPLGLVKRIAIDPASADPKKSKNPGKIDDQVIGVVGFKGPDVYLIEYTAEKGEMPDAAAATFMDYILRHTILRACVESVAYQRVLAWFIRKAMEHGRKFVPVKEITDKRAKADRIIQALRPKAAHGHLWVSIKHTKFIQQFGDYRPGVEMHDDVLDMVSIAITDHSGYSDEDYLEGEASVLDESDIPNLVLEHRCP